MHMYMYNMSGYIWINPQRPQVHSFTQQLGLRKAISSK